MFDFDVVTGPTQPPHCPLADDAGPAVAESAPQPAALTAGNPAPQPESGGKPRS